MNDTLTVVENAGRDAAAVVAALHSGDVDSAKLLLDFYASNRVAQAALCGSLAAFAVAVLKTVDSIGDEVRTVHGLPFPTSQQVLSSVLVKLAEPGPC